MLTVVATGLTVLMGPWVAMAQDAKGDRDLTTRRAEAEYLKARLAHIEAEIALIEFEQGNLSRALQAAKSDTTLAQSHLETRKEALEFTKKMFSFGYVPESRLTQEKLNYERAVITLATNKTKLELLERQSKKTHGELTADAEKALAEELAKKDAFERLRKQKDDQ
jgi:outer membrane protein TolC